ncbi:hypothetical protein BBOV_III007130 [Babesia bovis T2Bo]|uniref:hypothetical protein n=1 Tax=Babesia bovis T2Bo TaxID=484906 RepID=UPI001C35197B|nr:hypothetical protein BBOV_III007130 [Babesia bovis T2Bo]EDO08274.2 hypothetical protein BBOV_III007130 [Babesia bovis T2Bo]
MSQQRNMGKVKSFFKVLSCPKKTHNTKGEGRKRLHIKLSNPTDAKKNKSDIGASNIECGDNFKEVTVENFLFSTPTVAIDVVENHGTTAFDDPKHGLDTDMLLFQRQCALVQALCNTIRLKIRHNLIVSLVCLQQRTNKVHLLNYFIKKVVFVLKRNQERIARYAVIAIRQHKLSSIKYQAIHGAVTTISQIVFCKQYKLKYQGLKALVLYGRNSKFSGTALENKVLVTNHKDSKVRAGCKAVCEKSSVSVDGNVANVKTLANPLTSDLNDNDKLLHSTKNNQAGANLMTFTNTSQIKINSCLKPTTSMPNSPPTDIYSRENAMTKKNIGYNLFQKAIKNINFSMPAVVEQKDNLICDLEFFTAEPYASYVKKSMRCSNSQHHDNNL